jgi:hypothetical protein
VILGEEKLLKGVVHIIGHRFHELEFFSPLVADGEKDLIWALNAKLHLQGHGFAHKIEESSLEIPIDHFNAGALVFMRHHLHPTL